MKFQLRTFYKYRKLQQFYLMHSPSFLSISQRILTEFIEIQVIEYPMPYTRRFWKNKTLSQF